MRSHLPPMVLGKDVQTFVDIHNALFPTNPSVPLQPVEPESAAAKPAGAEEAAVDAEDPFPEADGAAVGGEAAQGENLNTMLMQIAGAN